MKKAAKIVFSMILLLIIAGAGIIYYFLEIKTYDITVDTEVNEIIGEEYEVSLPDIPNLQESQERDNPSAENSSTENTPSENSAAQRSPEENKQNQPSAALPAGEKKAAEITAESITNQYYPTFQSLQSQANAKMDALLSQAYGEFQAKRANGESISLPYFYQKYSGAGKKLEQSTDAAFETILNALHQDLKENGFDTSHADRFKEEYEAQKKEKEAAVLNKVKEVL